MWLENGKKLIHIEIWWGNPSEIGHLLECGDVRLNKGCISEKYIVVMGVVPSSSIERYRFIIFP
jgi:hypothetical protein